MTKVKIRKLPQSEVEIEGELEADIFETYFAKALQKIGENIEIDGFRKGKVPENVLLSKVPEIRVLEEMAEMALSEHYPKILEAEKLDVISRPEISITKLARKNPLGFKIKTALLPEVKLPDYKSVAKEILSKVTSTEKNITVSDEDVENTIMDIRRSRAPKQHISETDVEESKKSGTSSIDTNLPEFNDESVQALGPFKDITDFKDKLKINIKLEKENHIKEKTRLNIIDKIIDGSTIDVPNILVELELDKILYRMESDITQMGLKFEDYLKQLNKTIDELRKEFRKDAEKKAKLSLVLGEISKLEKIEADKEQVAKEVAHILEHYKDADPERAAIHAENVLINEKVFQFLENQ
jgi:FKBP-type peptidyl-prolyl cis-trans isomerase (trigger factor)